MIINKVFKIVLGSSLQWYDFALYGFFSAIFAQQYFPNENPQVALLSSFCAFAVGFIARPLGAAWFGRYGDIYGRTTILRYTPLLITVPTVLLAFIPTYQQIGILAPFLLVCNRILQGIFLGAEFGGNMVYLCESSPKRKFLLGSLGSCSGSFGILLASLIASMASILSPEQISSYGWRMTFAFSIFPGLIAWYMRRNMQETPEYDLLVSTKTTIDKPMRDISSQKQTIFVILSILCFQATTFYYIFMFLPNYLLDNSVLNIKYGFSYLSLVLALRLVLIPFIGWLADKYSGIAIYYASALIFVTCSYSLSKSFCDGGSYMSLLVLAMMSAINAGVVPGIITTMLKTRSRYTLFSFIFNIGFGVFGGCTPAICIYLGTIERELPFMVPVLVSIIGLSALLFTSMQGYSYGHLQKYYK